MKKEDNKINVTEVNKKKKASFFDFLTHKIDDDQFGKQEVSKEKRRNQIIILCITAIIFVICVVGVGILIWITKNKLSSKEASAIVEDTINSAWNFIDTIN